jgi:hypothetical protein
VWQARDDRDAQSAEDDQRGIGHSESSGDLVQDRDDNQDGEDSSKNVHA